MSGRGDSRELRRLETLERNEGKEEVRWSWDEFTAGGKVTKYISARKWYRADDGEWRPTKAGVTIRLGELDRVVAALQRVQRARDANGAKPAPRAGPRREPPPARPPSGVQPTYTPANEAELAEDAELF